MEDTLEWEEIKPNVVKNSILEHKDTLDSYSSYWYGVHRNVWPL